MKILGEALPKAPRVDLMLLTVVGGELLTPEVDLHTCHRSRSGPSNTVEDLVRPFKRSRLKKGVPMPKRKGGAAETAHGKARELPCQKGMAFGRKAIDFWTVPKTRGSLSPVLRVGDI